MLGIVLVGGNSARFAQAGYSGPKALLPMLDGRTMVEHVIESLGTDSILVCARERDRGILEPFFSEINQEHDRALKAVWGAGDAQGPASGILDAEPALRYYGGEVLVAYCDVLIRDGVADLVDDWRHCVHDAGALVFASDDPRFGYWKNGRVHEKVVASRWAVSGVFWFRRADDLLARARAQTTIGAGIVHLLDADTCLLNATGRVMDLGTPADYERYMLEGVPA